MIRLSLEKVVTIMDELTNGKSYIQMLKYKELPTAIAGINEVEVDYCFGQEKKRVKQLIELGFKLKENVWYNNDEVYSKIRQVWSR
jgi:hypothetical protein